MVLGPLGKHVANDPPRAGQLDPAARDAVLAAVRAAAARLVDDLSRAESLTCGWTDAPLSTALVDVALSQCLSRLAATNLWGEANRLPSNELWKIAGPLLEKGVLQSAARLKPRGYAGDFEMLARICQGYRCEHPPGRAFDDFFQSQAAPQAVRFRTEQTAAALAADCLARGRSPYHVASVGCGPALDLRGAMALLPEERRAQVAVTLLDLDPDALEFAAGGLRPFLSAGGSEAIRCIRTNLFRLPQQAGLGLTLREADFLVCSGLFDYLDDAPAASLLGWLWERLARGGTLLVGNFAPHNPTRAYMEWIGNWYLTYRTVDQLRALAAQASIPDNRVQVGCERLGIDLFLMVVK